MVELADHGFDIMLTSVSAEGLGPEWVGTLLDSDALGRLRTLSTTYRFNVDGEGGEFETAVVASPWMNGAIEMECSRHSSGVRHWLQIEHSHVV